MSQLRRHQDEIERLGLRVLVVTFETEGAAEEYVREVGLPWPLVIDASRGLYEAYGMGRGPWWAIWAPSTLWAYARLIARGRRPQRASADIDQLGGDVLIDPEATVVLHHVGTGPADRRPVRELLEPVRR